MFYQPYARQIMQSPQAQQRQQMPQMSLAQPRGQTATTEGGGGGTDPMGMYKTGKEEIGGFNSLKDTINGWMLPEAGSTFSGAAGATGAANNAAFLGNAANIGSEGGYGLLSQSATATPWLDAAAMPALSEAGATAAGAGAAEAAGTAAAAGAAEAGAAGTAAAAGGLGLLGPIGLGVGGGLLLGKMFKWW